MDFRDSGVRRVLGGVQRYTGEIGGIGLRRVRCGSGIDQALDQQRSGYCLRRS